MYVLRCVQVLFRPPVAFTHIVTILLNRQPRTFVPRALLYNDGGFDVSPDGKTLCACAEYWLPDGVDSAIELLNREEQVHETLDGNDPLSGSEDASSTGTINGNSSDQGKNLGSPGRDSHMEISPSQSSPPRHGLSSGSGSALPMTPPNPGQTQLLLSPPPPPGLRFSGGLGQNHAGSSTGAAPGDPPVRAEGTQESFTASSVSSRTQRPPHPLSIISGSLDFPDVARQPGRYVPHVVTVSLDTTPVEADSSSSPHQHRGHTTAVARGHGPRLGQLIEAAPLDGSKAAAVTCVKFSPSADFCLLGYGVREPVTEGGQHHPVTALYRVRGGMTHVSTMLSGDDDVNIARFHPDSGNGFVYGTKQGRVRVLSPRPWNYYNC